MVAVFGMLKRKGKVLTIIVPNMSTDTQTNKTAKRTRFHSIVCTDNYGS